MTTNQDPLDDILRFLYVAAYNDSAIFNARSVTELPRYEEVEVAKQKILAHYIERSKVEEAIGEDEPSNNPESEHVGTTYWRNKLRAEIRQKLDLGATDAGN